jgi:hypothetical protein
MTKNQTLHYYTTVNIVFIPPNVAIMMLKHIKIINFLTVTNVIFNYEKLKKYQYTTWNYHSCICCNNMKETIR